MLQLYISYGTNDFCTNFKYFNDKMRTNSIALRLHDTMKQRCNDLNMLLFCLIDKQSCVENHPQGS